MRRPPPRTTTARCSRWEPSTPSWTIPTSSATEPNAETSRRVSALEFPPSAPTRRPWSLLLCLYLPTPPRTSSSITEASARPAARPNHPARCSPASGHQLALMASRTARRRASRRGSEEAETTLYLVSESCVVFASQVWNRIPPLWNQDARLYAWSESQTIGRISVFRDFIYLDTDRVSVDNRSAAGGLAERGAGGKDEPDCGQDADGLPIYSPCCCPSASPGRWNTAGGLALAKAGYFTTMPSRPPGYPSKKEDSY